MEEVPKTYKNRLTAGEKEEGSNNLENTIKNPSPTGLSVLHATITHEQQKEPQQPLQIHLSNLAATTFGFFSPPLATAKASTTRNHQRPSSIKPQVNTAPPSINLPSHSPSLLTAQPSTNPSSSSSHQHPSSPSSPTSIAALTLKAKDSQQQLSIKPTSSLIFPQQPPTATNPPSLPFFSSTFTTTSLHHQF